MPDDENWLWRPVLEGIVRYESMISTELDLNDWANMNDALDVRDENRRRLDEFYRNPR
jgi:hypothetical protein